MKNQEEIHARFKKVRDLIDSAARSAGRDPRGIRLVVVTKAHSIEVVREAVRGGARLLGENYAEEAIPKIEAIKHSDLGDSRVEWHMIGHVQSRKAKIVAEQFAFLHSLDRIKLARRLNRFCEEKNRILPVLLQVNVSGEESKFGLPATNDKEWYDLLSTVEKLLEFSNLKIQGLMTIPPFLNDMERIRSYFRRLKGLQKYLKKHISQVQWDELSMGMSSDYEVAIQEGATMLRIGEAILGPRPQ